MDDNNTMQDTRVELSESDWTDDLDAELDQEWGIETQRETESETDVTGDLEEEEGEDQPDDSNEGEAEDGAGETGEDGGTETVTGEEEGESEGAEGEKADQPETFELRWLGETKSVGRDEVIKLAQQGMDYPRIREKWDAVKDDVPKLRMYESFLNELAQGREGGVEALIDETRARTLMAKAKAEGRELDPTTAAIQATRARLTAMTQHGAPAAEPEQELNAEDALKEKMDKAIKGFLSEMGNAAPKFEEIPQEVWDETKQTGDMVSAWRKFERNRLQDENRKLQKELELLKQQQKNKARSTGSQKSSGSAKVGRDPVDEGWSEGWN